MNMLTTSIKREIWEFKTTLFWVPVSLIGIIFASFLINLIFEGFQIENVIGSLKDLDGNVNVEGGNVSFGIIFTTFLPFLLFAGFVSLHYFLSCLYDERRDQSVYFWRSMPVSDHMTIGIKLLMGAVIIPIVFMLFASLVLFVILISFLVLSIILSVGYDVSVWGIWSQMSFISDYFSIWALLIPFTLWFLPIYAWLMLASAFANKAPFLWALLPVLALAVISAILEAFGVTSSNFVSEILHGYFNFDAEDFVINGEMINRDNAEDINVFVIFRAMLSKVSVVALLMSGLFLFGAYWLRRHKSAA